MEGIILSERNSTRSGCKDVFHAFLVKNATYAGELKEVDSWIHYKEKGIEVLQFDSDFMKSRKAVSA